ncbi:hypothetical protein RIR_jg40636.t1 [Rhizophagus irregularis DAOM 181602=DAOM 197198]|nr:hypothetical protein RIR_jg40636.t1 [Rhizophagus irregularis DAOM 181602=DAOM 197198]
MFIESLSLFSFKNLVSKNYPLYNASSMTPTKELRSVARMRNIVLHNHNQRIESLPTDDGNDKEILSSISEYLPPTFPNLLFHDFHINPFSEISRTIT